MPIRPSSSIVTSTFSTPPMPQRARAGGDRLIV
jgi:hypothetical protein